MRWSNALPRIVALVIPVVSLLAGCGKDFDGLFEGDGGASGADSGTQTFEIDGGSRPSGDDASASQPPPDARACRAESSCDDRKCTFRCEDSGCVCPKAACGNFPKDEECRATCARGTSCEVTAAVQDKADFTCQGCTGKFSCSGADARCTTTCTDGASCETSCTSFGSCTMVCQGNSTCMMTCGLGASCELDCQGTAQVCPNGARVCNRPCP